MTKKMKTNPKEFSEFHNLLMRSAPKGFYPFYFPLEIDGKDPLQDISWKKNKKTAEEAIRFLEFGYNIGIAATDRDPLVIIDVDDPAQVTEIKPTLQVISSKQEGTHNYYFTQDPAAKRNIPTENAGEIRASWQYVVAPGSFVIRTQEEIARMPADRKKFAGQYILANKLPVSEISFNEFPEVYRARASKEAEIRKEKGRIWTNLYKNKTVIHKSKSALWNLSLYDVTGLRDNPGIRFPMPVEFHGSETGKNASVSGGCLHCWRHMCYHNGLTALAVLAGIATCSEAGIPHGNYVSGVNFENPEVQFELWMYAYKHGMLPSGDKIPVKALRYYAESRKSQEGLPDDCRNYCRKLETSSRPT